MIQNETTRGRLIACEVMWCCCLSACTCVYQYEQTVNYEMHFGTMTLYMNYYTATPCLSQYGHSLAPHFPPLARKEMAEMKGNQRESSFSAFNPDITYANDMVEQAFNDTATSYIRVRCI